MKLEVVTSDSGLEVKRHLHKFSLTEDGGRSVSEVQHEVQERRDEPKVKKPKKHKAVNNVKLPVEPFVLDEVKLMDKYQDSPNHIAIIRGLPRLGILQRS